MNKWLLWGGGGAAVLVAGFLLLRGGGSSGGESQSSGDLGSYYPATVYGGGMVSTGDGTVSTGTSTDDSIAQLIAGNLAIAQEQSSASRYLSDNDKAIALAQYGSQTTIASNDNATKLAMALDTNKTAIQTTLATQLAGITNRFSGNGVVGSLGFDGDSINVDLRGLVTTPTRSSPIPRPRSHKYG